MMQIKLTPKQKLYALISMLGLFCYGDALSQMNFRAGIESADPVEKNSPIDFDEKVRLHSDFLKLALSEGDRKLELYGYLYLAQDFALNLDYTEATRYLLEAQTIAEEAGQPGWLGWVVHRKGVVATRIKDFQKASEEYGLAATLCAEGGDSLCLAESLEQLSLVNARLENFEKAQYYHEISMPLIEKYGGQEQLGAALNNFGIIHSIQDHPAEAIPYFERSIDIYHQLNKYKEESKALNNLADAYRRQKHYDLAIEIYEKCLLMNEEHQITENLISNYSGLVVLSEERGDYQTAYEYMGKYYDLRDSIAGEETNRKIAELEVQYQSQRKELELERSRTAHLQTRRSLEISILVIISLLLLAGLGVWRWKTQTKMVGRELLQNQRNLTQLTKILLTKNEQLALLNEKISLGSISNDEEAGLGEFGDNVYDLRILTDSDWQAFKSSFENVYPGYINLLRKHYPSLSEGEERLSLLIKLKLSSKEIASILGISPDSVKKTRYRMRKKLDLPESVRLESVILDL
ncbi:MAG: tetratricopeptide repeat protein [Saprospiraceae bacterium]|nr:tetratricopeptide repeat protein [Saprospiraceae bacterium]